MRQQAEIHLQEMGLDASMLDEVIRRVEETQDIALDGIFVVPPEDPMAGEDNPAVWLPSTDTPLVRRYLKLLEREDWTVEARVRLSRTTRTILGRCGNPSVSGPWSRRGMVVGDVQSGKTTSYVTLICAAIDAGYRNIVVLGGRTNDLRHQTQERVDLGVTGVESSRTSSARRTIGVGLIEQVPGLTMVSLTSQDHVSGRAGGDFDTRRAGHDNISGDAVCIAVIKKHATMIGNVRGWLTDTGKAEAGPLLLIDDEADDASIDTNEPGETPTAINGAIRELLGSVSRSSYVAYTATPYANVMIDPDGVSDTHGQDLFPCDFIALLTPPPIYFGARRFLAEDDRSRRICEVTDAEGWLVRGQVAGDLPRSLCGAIREFILVSAARRVRRRREGKPRQHETMLIHATVRAGSHLQIERQVQDEVDRLQEGWAFPTGEARVREAFGKSWRDIGGKQDPAMAVTWEELEDDILGVMEDLKVESINGVTKAALDYRRASSGALTVIAIGGMKLSRGLTLEGLTTSYHIRSTRQHDTLMQMCRWFGYRVGYEDLCRLYTEPDLLRAFTEVMESDEELRTELEDMASLGATPLEFGLRVRTSPGMTITGRNKLRHAVTLRDALGGKTLEVTRTALEDAGHNDMLLQDLVAGLGRPQREEGGTLAWDGVSWEVIRPALEGFRELPSSVGLPGRVTRALSYIRSAQTATPQRLLRWTVALAGLKSGETERYGGLDITRVRRTPQRTEEPGVLNFGAISDPADERIARGAGEGTTRREIRASRPKEEGLLIIYPIRTPGDDGLRTSGVALSFPEDAGLRKHLYVLNSVAQRQEMGVL
ncbi:endonuclease [Deinococcus metallilatus]|nr:endonuclease [Deinococcus metallilatus]